MVDLTNLVPLIVGAAVLLPLTLVSLAMPRCGAPCLQVNLATAAALGFVEAGLAYALTGLHRADSREPR